jgi:hypothetical protein
MLCIKAVAGSSVVPVLVQQSVNPFLLLSLLTGSSSAGVSYSNHQYLQQVAGLHNS